ncbi:MAG: carbohydrate ABC transporter permease [Treponema sp.]|nr:carbohydrate ABC transporter permease [Treponema sp.]
MVVILCLMPMLNVLAVSLSSNNAIINGKVGFWPVGFTLRSYQTIFADISMIQSLVFTIQMTAIYTLFSMLLTIACAYPLSKRELKGKRIFLMFIIITMYFSGGIIPDYMLVQSLGLLNTQWALILPGLISTFNVIIMRTFFSQLPENLEEAAMIDGASDAYILVRIVLPLSLAVIATLSLFYAVSKWNSLQDALFYITNPKLYPLQLRLNAIISNAVNINTRLEATNYTETQLPEALKAACIMFATIPIIIVYPWLQKYFVKGVTLGAVKG